MGSTSGVPTPAGRPYFEAAIRDAVSRSERQDIPVFTAFLTETEQAAAEGLVRRAGAVYRFFGGYDGAERRMLGVFPPGSEPDDSRFPIDAVTVTVRSGEKPDHRSVLGTLMAQGVERDCVGDILCEEGRAVFFCRATVTAAFLREIRKIGGLGADLAAGFAPPLPAAHTFREITDTVASERLDCLVAALARVGRTEAEALILAGDVMIDSVPCKKTSQKVEEGRKITVRGKGKFIIDAIGAMTKKGRRKLSARKYC